MPEQFIEHQPTRESCWRAIVMMGQNVASYKFALAALLIELSSNRSEFIPLENLAVPFSRNLCEHLKHAEKQITARGSRFLDACKQANSGEISSEELLESTVNLGFINVIDAFHVVNRKNTPIKFFNDDRKTRGGITLTDEFFQLAEGGQFDNLPHEVEARWNIVETAWELNMAANLLRIEFYYEGQQALFPQVAQGFEELVGYIGRLVDLNNRALADGLDRLIALLPVGNSQKSVEPFGLDVSTLDGLTEQPAKHETAYLVDMAKVDALDTLGEKEKAVKLLDRHVWREAGS